MNGMHRASLKRRLMAAAVVAPVLLPIAFVTAASGAPNQPTTIGIGSKDPGKCNNLAGRDLGRVASQEIAQAKLYGDTVDMGVTADPASGNLFVSDHYWVHLVRGAVNRATLPESTQIETIAGLPGEVHPQGYLDFNPAIPADSEPGAARDKRLAVSGMVTDGAGTLYIADYSLGYLQIRRLTEGATWQITTVAIDKTAEAPTIPRTLGMAMRKGQLLIPQPDRGRVSTVSGGQLVSVLGGLNSPRSVAVDGAGSVYVADANGVGKYASLSASRESVGGFTAAARLVAVNSAGTTLFAALENKVFQVDLDKAPGTSELLMDAQTDFSPESLWFGGTPARLFMGSCRPRSILPLEPPTPPTTRNTGPGTSSPPGTVPVKDAGPLAPAGGTGDAVAPASDGGASQASAPVAQGNAGGQTSGAGANAFVAPPGGGGSQFVGGGASSGNGGGGGLPPSPPPINTPMPQTANALAPGSLGPPPPGASPSPHAGLAAVPGDAALGAPRYAMVRNDSATGPGPVAFASGAAALVGCVALCALGLSKSRGRPQPGPARARAW